MYSIYVTNESGVNVYVRLQRLPVSSLNESFHQELDKLSGREASKYRSQTASSINLYLVRWGFCTIPPGKTMSFAVEVVNNEARMYASLYAQSKLWIMDYEMNCIRYGCLFVKNDGQPASVTERDSWRLSQTYTLCLSQANPEPLWIPRKAGECFPADIIKAGSNAVEGSLFFGRSSHDGTKPCTVTTKAGDSDSVLVYSWFSVNGEELLNGELLKDTGHEFARTSRGDLMPPNAVIGGVSDSEGTLYLGRVGGNTPCSVSTESGRIKYFCFYAGKRKQVGNGEILVLIK